MSSTPGLLRLKGSSSKISKPNKLKKKKINTETPAASSADSTATHPNSSNISDSSALLDSRDKQPSKKAEELEAERDKEQQETTAVTKAHHDASDDEEGEATAVPKTEAELRYEERKRRRVSDTDILHFMLYILSLFNNLLAGPNDFPPFRSLDMTFFDPSQCKFVPLKLMDLPFHS